MVLDNLVKAAQRYFPDVQMKYKNESLLMKIIGKLLFFNPVFMTGYTTTLGSTIYFPSEAFLKYKPVTGAVIFMHELMHVKDAKQISKPLFTFLYASPQILVLFCLALFFCSWKLALLLTLLCLAPIPSYFRMHFEKRAYITSLYVINGLSKRFNFNPDLENNKNFYINQFKGPYYYYMWPFSNLEKDFSEAIIKIQAGQRPFEDSMFDILDDLITKV